MSGANAMRTTVMLLCLLVAACGSLPDVKPFADSTAAIHSGMRSVGDAAIERVEENLVFLSEREKETTGGAQDLFRESKKTQEGALKELKSSFASIVQTGGAFVDYADSLQAIVAAANKASDSAENLANSVNKFATALTGDPLITPAIAKAAARVAKEVATIRASRSLQAAMEQATPAINEVADELIFVVQQSKRIFSENQRNLARREVDHDLLRKYGFDQSFRNQVVREREKTFRKISLDCGKADCAVKEAVDELKVLDQLYERTQPFAVERAAEIRKVDENHARQTALLTRVEASLIAWKNAHASLLVAVKENRQFNARQLVELAQDIRDIIREGKNNGK